MVLFKTKLSKIKTTMMPNSIPRSTQASNNLLTVLLNILQHFKSDQQPKTDRKTIRKPRLVDWWLNEGAIRTDVFMTDIIISVWISDNFFDGTELEDSAFKGSYKSWFELGVS